MHTLRKHHKKTIGIMFATLGAAAINLVLNFFAIRLFGYQAAAYTTLIADLSTYMAEHVLKFVVGDEDMSGYSDFVSTLYDMGMQEAIDYRQAAYDRYIGG